VGSRAFAPPRPTELRDRFVEKKPHVRRLIHCRTTGSQFLLGFNARATNFKKTASKQVESSIHDLVGLASGYFEILLSQSVPPLAASIVMTGFGPCKLSPHCRKGHSKKMPPTGPGPGAAHLRSKSRRALQSIVGGNRTTLRRASPRCWWRPQFRASQD